MSLTKYSFNLQGHRGARGLLPENSLEAFEKAIEIEVDTLEIDVVISKDYQVVVSHEAFMHPDICIQPNGQWIMHQSQFNLYKMSYSQIKKFDCGSIKHPNFNTQKPISTYKPLLSEVLQLAIKNELRKCDDLAFNIEIKSLPKTDGIYHPRPKVYVELVLDVVKNSLGDLKTITLQSFDKRVVRYIIENYPDIKVSCLVNSGFCQYHFKQLGLLPTIYGPNYKIVSKRDI